MPSYGLIGGTGLGKLLKKAKERRRKTPYGPVDFYEGAINDETVFFIARHGKKHQFPPHKIPYRANIWLLYKLGVERVMALNAVGAINQEISPGDIVVPHDFVDFTKQRPLTFYDAPPVTHIDVSVPYCPEVRDAILRAARRCGERTWEKAVMACTEGPRYETPAEVRMISISGCDVVGMTGIPEAPLARELGMCYATLCFVSNAAAGLQKRLTASEVIRMADEKLPKIREIVVKTIDLIPKNRKCLCKSALEGARVC